MKDEELIQALDVIRQGFPDSPQITGYLQAVEERLREGMVNRNLLEILEQRGREINRVNRLICKRNRKIAGLRKFIEDLKKGSSPKDPLVLRHPDGEIRMMVNLEATLDQFAKGDRKVIYDIVP